MTHPRPSIAVVLVAAVVAVVSLLLGTLAVVAHRSESIAHHQTLKRELAARADRAAEALALPMRNSDERQVQGVVENLMLDRDLAAIESVTSGQRHLLVRDAAGSAVEALAPPAIEGLYLEEREVRQRDEVVGRVRMWASPRSTGRDPGAWRSSALTRVLVADAGLAVTLAALLWWFLLRPVRALERFAVAVQPGEPCSPPDPALFRGELAALRDSISQMVDRLDSRYRALRDSEERLRLATRSASLGVWDWDVVNDELVWDDVVGRMYGFPEGKLSGRIGDWFDRLLSSERERAGAEVEAALTGERPFDSEFRIQCRDGATCVIRCVSIGMRTNGGRVVRMVGIHRDVTERRAAEAAVRTLNAGLEQRVEERTAQLLAAVDEVVRARDQAESATRSNTELLTHMSHELRAPMNVVIGMTELALRTETTPQQRGYLTNAKAAAESLLGVLNDILDFSKIEAGKLEMEHRPFMLGEVLDKVTSVVGPRAREKSLTLTAQVAEGVPGRLVGDPSRLAQVLINLCANAVKFTEHGDVAVTVTLASPSQNGTRASLRFDVRDTGIGMTAGQVAELFLPFQPVDVSTARKDGGAGLGLAICRRLVGLMGGEITVVSEPARGSAFSFAADFGVEEHAADDRVSGRRHDDDATAFAVLRERRVLLVEDNELNQIVAGELLREACGMHVTVAGSGREALDQLQQAEFDIVLMDVQMPEMDGCDVTRQIRRDPSLANLPIIAMTAHAMARDREMCFAAGMNAFIAKPFDPHELFVVLSQWIDVAPVGDTRAASSPSSSSGGVSFELGLRRCLGRTDLYEKIVRRYLTTRISTPEEIRACLDGGDPRTGGRIAHSLISTAGIVGASDLSDAARALQVAIDGNDRGRWVSLLDDLAKEHEAVCVALSAYLTRNAGSAPAPEAGSPQSA